MREDIGSTAQVSLGEVTYKIWSDLMLYRTFSPSTSHLVLQNLSHAIRDLCIVFSRILYQQEYTSRIPLGNNALRVGIMIIQKQIRRVGHHPPMTEERRDTTSPCRRVRGRPGGSCTKKLKHMVGLTLITTASGTQFERARASIMVHPR